MFSRAIRRHHRDRLRKVRVKHFRFRLRPADHETISRLIDTPKGCSCYGCGNARHAFGRDICTMQERRAFQCEEWDIEDGFDDAL